MSNPPRVFIASSREALSVAEAVNIKLDGFAQVKQWDNAFDLSSLTLPSLIARTEETDFAVFVFHKDDKTIIRGNEYSSVRDNVIFELGLFIGTLGLEKCFVLVPKSAEGNFRLPTDLLGMTVTAYDDSLEDMTDAVTASCAKVKQSIRKLTTKNDGADTLTEVPPSPQSQSDPLNLLQSELWRARIELQQIAEKNSGLQNAIVNHFFAAAKPATESEIKAWIEGAKENYSEQFRLEMHNAFYVDRDVIIPAMHGASSISVIVASGARVFGLDQWSHNTVYFMDGYRRYGR